MTFSDRYVYPPRLMEYLLINQQTVIEIDQSFIRPWLSTNIFVAIFKGLTSNEGTFPILNVDQCSVFPPGPICRYSEDLELVLKVLIGDNQKRLVNYDNVSIFGKKINFQQHIFILDLNNFQTSQLCILYLLLYY